MLTIRLLGTLEVEVDGMPVAIPGTKTRTLLCRLALEHGVVVSTDRLIDALWGDRPPAQALNALQAKVSALRKTVGADRVEARPPGYRLRIDRDQVDLCRFEDTVAAARRLAPDHPERASGAYASALDLWRGEVIAGLVDPESGIALANPVDELRLAAFEERCRIELDLGRGHALIGALEQVIAGHPVRESSVELHMLALAGAGRQADALASYRRLRTRLVEELGIEPTPRLRQLERAVLTQDPGVVDLVAAPSTRTRHLPNPLSSFVDRPDEVTSVIDLLRTRRLVTITGRGGAGKTRLAIEAARRMEAPADGVWFVGLLSVIETDQVCDAIGTVLSATGPDAVEAVRRRLHDASLLLVLDNCEHLDDTLGDVITRLLDDAPGLSILATSQRSLGVVGEVTLPLGALSSELATRLFAERASDHMLDDGLDDHHRRALTEQICNQLDGLPLAIELAARRCDVLTLDEIAGHIRSGRVVLRDSSRGRDERHRTLDATIAWSYDLLFPDGQLMMQALAAFADGAPLDGIEIVGTSLGLPRGEALDLVSNLVDRSLVVVERHPAGSRYHLLASIAAFARGRATDDGRDEIIADAHATWVAGVVAMIVEDLGGEAYFSHLETVRRERSNVDTGLRRLMRLDRRRALELTSGLFYAWMIVGDAAAGAARIERALLLAGSEAPVEQRALAAARAAQLLARSGSIDRAVEFSERALSDVAGGSEANQAEVSSTRGRVLVHVGRFDEGRDLEIDACRRFESLGDAWGVAMARLTIAWANMLQGDRTGAGIEAQAALDALGGTTQPWITHAGHRLLGVLATDIGQYHVALDHFRVALDTARALGSLTDEGQTLARLASAHLLRGDQVGALDALVRALEISRLAGDQATASDVADQIDALRSAGALAQPRSTALTDT